MVRLVTLLVTPLVTLLALLAAPAAPAVAGDAQQARTPVTPRSLYGYAFTPCATPEQRRMDVWRNHSPYLAVGVNIAGYSRACRNQRFLTEAWVATQLRKGWRILPITTGPQAACHPRYPRYGDDRRIDARPGRDGRYERAREMGRASAGHTAAIATELGLRPGSTLWYDLEDFDAANERCRRSALGFLSGWTFQLHRRGFRSGVQSGADSGIAALDRARAAGLSRWTLPDAVWLTQWDGVASADSAYLADDAWRPGGRVKEYQGFHNESYGGTTIDVARSWVALGKRPSPPAEDHCDGTQVSFRDYPAVRAPRTRGGTTTTSPPAAVLALQCLLREKDVYHGRLTGSWGPKLERAVTRFRDQHGFEPGEIFGRGQWTSLLSLGRRSLVKVGSAGPAVRRVQRAVNATAARRDVGVSGVFGTTTEQAVRSWQRQVGLEPTGSVSPASWQALVAGRTG